MHISQPSIFFDLVAVVYMIGIVVIDAAELYAQLFKQVIAALLLVDAFFGRAAGIKRGVYFFISDILPLVRWQPDVLLLRVFISPSRKSGCATEMSASARSHVVSPARFTAPYSVTM